ncbi:MAG TPA: type I methionyl aminopeptidase [Actinobacteria bacterium]|nr:type I methionyl aminopeptidase [Actinomycetes bacterium]HEX21385.1 type I methionyl aminopeptidase [Actinomycetota bacterium]
MIICKGEKEIAQMRQAGRIVAGALELARKSVRPKLKTIELDIMIENYILTKGGKPAFKGYHGYPASICASINQEVVHGIPGSKRLSEGDIISVDIGVELNGYFADAAATFAIGKITDKAKRLMKTTELSLEAGIEQVRIGNKLSDISHAIQKKAEAAGYSVVRDYVGHGIGREMHEDPQIPNYGPPGQGPELREGMVLALEPMLNLGGSGVKVLSDSWSVVTADNSLSAHFEHSVAVTAVGPDILTKLAN